MVSLLVHSLLLWTAFFASEGPDEGRVAYFSTLAFAESPLPPIRGSIPLDRPTAASRNHYRFVYDQQGRLASVGFYNGDRRRAPNHTANLFFLASELRFTYREGAEEIAYFDRFGNPVRVWGEVARSVYTLNEQGHRVALHFEDTAGHRLENSWSIWEYRWAHQPDGTVIEERFDRAGHIQPIRPHFEFYRLRLHYDHLGHIALMQQIDQGGNLVENSSGAAQDRITTDANGLFRGWSVLDQFGNLERGNSPDVARGFTTFDRYGYEIATHNEDEHGNRIYNTYGFCASKTQFDRFGNLSSRTFYDEKGRPAPHKRAGYVSLTMFWDATGNHRLGLRYSDLNGRPVAHAERGYAEVRQAYDDSGNLVKVTYLDTEGNRVNRKDNGIATVRLTYDQENRLVRRERFDKEGTLLPVD